METAREILKYDSEIETLQKIIDALKDSFEKNFDAAQEINAEMLKFSKKNFDESLKCCKEIFFSSTARAGS